MDLSACAKNLTGCLTSLGLKLCAADKDVCSGRGLCITSIIPSTQSVCICSPCYYGPRCENEMFSKNLWFLGQPARTSEMILAMKILLLVFVVVRAINCLLCLQTYSFSRKIRLTNIGIYLIFNSIILLLMTLEEMTIAILVWFPDKLPDEYFRISCWLNQKFLVVSLNYMLGWSIFFISFERMLVECFGYGLFDSRKRSIVISILNFIICPLTTLPGIFTLKQLPTDQINPIINRALLPSSCVNPFRPATRRTLANKFFPINS